MKLILIILLSLLSKQSISQNTWVKWNGHIFLKQGNDSTYFGEDAILSTMPSVLTGTSIKTINGTSLMGSGNIVVGSSAWGGITGTLSNQSDLQTALNAKLATNGNGSSLTGLTATQVGLGNVNNTSDANKPISTAEQTALNLKANLASPTFTGTVSGITSAMVGLGNVDNTSDANKPVSSATQTALNLKANLASPTFTGTVSGITASMVGLGNVTNESKATMFTSPTFTGTVSGVTATMVGLGNVTNESKATMFSSPVFTGTPTGIGIPVYARVTGSNATTTGQALTNVTGLSVALTTNATYEFEANLTVSTTAVTTGTQYGVNYSVAGGAVEATVNGSLTTTSEQMVRLNALNTATVAYLTTSAQSGGIVIKGIVTTGANAGNFTVQHLKAVSGTSTVFINSYLKVTRIL